MRIQQGKHDEVKPLAGVLNITARIIVHLPDARRVVGPFEMKLLPQFKNQGIDFNRSHFLRAVSQSSRNIVSHPRAKNQD